MAKTKEPGVKKTPVAKKQTVRPSLEQVQDEIKALAHQVYLKRIEKNEAGDELSDWLKAESEIKKKYKL